MLKENLEKAAAQTPEILERKTYKTISKLQDEAKDIAHTIQNHPEVLDIDVMTSRAERKLLRGLLTQTLMALGLPKDATPEVQERIQLLRTAIRKFR